MSFEVQSKRQFEQAHESARGGKHDAPVTAVFSTRVYLNKIDECGQIGDLQMTEVARLDHKYFLSNNLIGFYSRRTCTTKTEVVNKCVKKCYQG